MRKVILLTVSLAAIAIAAACSKSNSATGTPTATGTLTPTPTPTGTGTPAPVKVSYQIDGINFNPHEGFDASVRVLSNTGTVLYCNSALAIGAVTANQFTIGPSTAVLTSGETYTVELFAKLEAGTTYDSAIPDHTWTFGPSTATTNIVFTYSHGAQSAITWVNGKACPGM